MAASTPSATAKAKKNWHQMCYQIGVLASCLQDIYENVSESEDGRDFPELSEELIAVGNILSITTRYAIQNETIHAMQSAKDVPQEF